MGGAAPGSVEGTNFDPNVLKELQQNAWSLNKNTANFSQSANQAANSLFTNFSQFNPSLNSNFAQHNPNLNADFKGPNFSNDLDSFSQNVLSRGLGDIATQRAAQNANIAQSLRGSPQLAKVLQAQGNSQSQLAGNPLLFEATANQRARQGQEYLLGQQAQSLSNATRLAQGQELSRLQGLGNNTQLQQSEASANLAGLGNAAQGQKVQLQGAGLNAQQGLMAVLAALGGLTGQRYATPIEGSGGGGGVGGKVADGARIGAVTSGLSNTMTAPYTGLGKLLGLF